MDTDGIQKDDWHDKFNFYRFMKCLIYAAYVLLLAGCERNQRSKSIDTLILSKKSEIIKLVEQFETSSYKKISFGEPNFLTFIDLDGQIREVWIPEHRAAADHGNIESIARNYRDQFRALGIGSLYRSNEIYIDFKRGRHLLITKDSRENITWLLGKRAAKSAKEIYPNWYFFLD